MNNVSDLVLAPPVRLLWRSADTVQLELGSRSVVLEGVDEDELSLLTRRPRRTRRAARDAITANDRVRQLLHELAESGYLWRSRFAESVELGDRATPALLALATRFGDAATDILTARERRAVVISGTGRVAVQVGCLLAAAGVGRVHFLDSGDVGAADPVPGGLTVDDEGRRFATAAHDALLRAAPHIATGPCPTGIEADLLVIACDGDWLAPDAVDHWLAAHPDQAHLAARASGDHGVIGPLVVPGRTSCLQCAELHRLDRDQAWRALAMQLATGRPRHAVADVAVSTTVAGVTCLQALAYLDGENPATLNGTIELQLPDWRLRRRSRWPHSACRCRGRTDADPRVHPDAAADAGP